MVWKRISGYDYPRWESKSRSLIIAKGFIYRQGEYFRVLVNDLAPNIKRYVDESFDTMKEAMNFAEGFMKENTD